jgi:hypothetical protein
MRLVNDHVVDGDTAPQLRIEVLDEPGQGGANHEYVIAFDGENGKGVNCHVSFQNGPIKEYGVNGVTQETLLAVVIDRLRSFQAGPFACAANAMALHHTEAALELLQQRTKDRIARGVEGQTKL